MQDLYPSYLSQSVVNTCEFEIYEAGEETTLNFDIKQLSTPIIDEATELPLILKAGEPIKTSLQARQLFSLELGIGIELTSDLYNIRVFYNKFPFIAKRHILKLIGRKNSWGVELGHTEEYYRVLSNYDFVNKTHDKLFLFKNQ